MPPEEGKSYVDTETKDLLTVSPTAKKIAEDGTASFTFSLSIIFPSGKAVDFENNQATLSFSAVNGSVSPSSATTDAKGQVTVTFTTTDAQNFEGGTVTGVVKKVEGKDLFQQGDLATATAQVLPLNAEEPVGDEIKKAEALRGNTYSIQKTGGEAQVFDFPQKYSHWYETVSKMDPNQQALHLDLMDDDDLITMGWAGAELPQAIVNKLTTLNQEFYRKYPWAATSMGTLRLGGKMIEASMGQGGNVKLDGRSQIWLKEKSGTKAYSGDYRFLFVFVFESGEYDSETGAYVPNGEEYTICGNTIVEKLTATRSADNQQVELTFGYAGTEMTYSMTFYNGPGYTSFSLSPKEGSADFVLVENDPAYGWSSDDIWFTADEWTPEAYSFNGYGIEIDPATKNYDKLYYNPYGKYVSFRKGIPEEDFDLIFRSVTDHSVKCTIPVKVVNHKAISFQITYKHKNGAFEPWTSGGENGICNYGMGMEVGVITEPKDAYWDWSHVELASNGETFTFSGHGGRDDHPKLQLKTSHGSEILGSQVIFCLKWDNRKKSTIYVDHN